MIGWGIVISTQTEEERELADTETRRAALLAHWDAGGGGTSWLSALVSAGKAVQTGFGGYPQRYTALASDVLPLVENGGVTPPDDGLWIFGLDEGEEYIQPPGWISNLVIHHDRIKACPPDQQLAIEAWDLS